MAGDDSEPTDPVAAAFARTAGGMRAVGPPELQYHTGDRLTRSLSAICNGLILLGILLAIAGTTYAFFHL